MSKQFHKTIFDNMPNAAMVLDTNLVFIEANEAYCRTVKRHASELIGQHVYEVFTEPPELLRSAMENFRKTLAGESLQLDALPYQVKTDDGQVEDRILQVSQFPIRCAEGKVEFIVQRFVDVTERETLRKERDLVTAELNHRVRNTLAVVQSVAEHTGLAAKDYPSFIESFQGRLLAISRNYAALSEAHWQGLDFETVIRAELEPYVGSVLERVDIDGAPLTLGVKATKDASMLVHELITNASKHGFLKQPDGRLSIKWRIEDSILHVSWRELGLTGISTPSRTGFGFQLFELMPNISVEKDFAPDGLKLNFEIPTDIVSNELVFARR